MQIWQLFIVLGQPVDISNLANLTNYLFIFGNRNMSRSITKQMMQLEQINKTDLQAICLSGTNCHKTGTRPPSCINLDNRLYMSLMFNQ